MRSLHRAKGGLCLAVIIVLIAPSLNGAGSGSWTDSGADFLSGEQSGTVVVNGTVALDTGNSSEGNWVKTMDWDGPPQRYGHAMAFDSRNGLLIAFGGLEQWPGNNTWTYDLQRKTWTDRNPALAPPHRSQTGMAFDDRNGVAVLYGGWGNRGDTNDTWTYDATTNTWKDITTGITPGNRYGHKLVYDAADGVVLLFGGSGSKGGRLNDTWSLDTESGKWTRLDCTGAPSPRDSFGMAYDSAAGEVIVYGGEGADETDNTWAFNYSMNAWRKLDTKGSPGARAYFELVYDEENRVAVLFGGEGEDAHWADGQNDTWAFSTEERAWTKKNPVSAPAGRDRYGMAYDSRNKRTVIHGGVSRITAEFDTWAYDAGSDSWEDRTPRTAPYPRSYHSLVYDEKNRATILFGGLDGLNDTWTYRVGENLWTDMKPPSSPRARSMQAMAYDSDRGFAVLYGGRSRSALGHSGEVLNDTWTYDLARNRWEPVNLSGKTAPPALCAHAMTYDTKNRVMVVFGGVGRVMGGGEAESSETWLYYTESNTWVNATPAESPQHRCEHSMVYDESTGLVVLFAGVSWSHMHAFNDTWTYDVSLNKWTLQPQSNAPQPNPDYSLAYIPPLGEVMVFGGGTHDWARNDTWLYNTTANSWRMLRPEANPTPRYGQAMVYDTLNTACIIFSGLIPHDFGNRMDTWVFGPLPGGGAFTSRPFDAGGTAFFGSIAWNATVPPGAGLRFQTRAAESLQDLIALPFIGPDGSAGSFYDRSGQGLSGKENGSRWIQYRATFRSSELGITPVLRSVEIGFNLVHRVQLLAPSGGENWTGPHKIVWSASDPDNDTLSFDLYLENAAVSIPLASNLPGGTSSWYWDTGAVPNGTYRIRISAADNNPSIPLTVKATSGNFTIYHPPPPSNRLPHVDLLSPPNNSVVNSTGVLLEWNGTDADNDPLMYTVLLSDHPIDEGPATLFRTGNQSLEIGDLADNRTYYWTVIPDDARTSLPPEPVPVWTFTVRLPPVIPPPVNHPPTITSLPRTAVTAGDLYQYNVTAIDEDFTVLQYSLVDGPVNMTIDSVTGRLRWPTTVSEVGNHTVTVRVTDTGGASDNQTFTVLVHAPFVPPQKPTCAITSPANGSKASGRILIRGTATNGTLPLAAVQVRIDSGQWQTAVGTGNWSMTFDLSRTPDGRHRIEARAFDGSLCSDTASIQVDVRKPEPPTTIDEPPWLIILLIIAVAAGAGAYLAFRRRKGP